MSIKRRLAHLEHLQSQKTEDCRSPDEVYDGMREEAKKSIAESLAAGEEPIYRIAPNGDVLTADGRLVRHLGDFIRALDERIAELVNYSRIS